VEDAARGLLVAHAEGNPFFAEEVLSELLDRALLERRNGGFALRDEKGGLGIPDSVQGVLAARIDLLGAEAKEALQAAAVIGRSFSLGGLAALTGSAAEVRTLVERGFVRPTEPEVAFKHALTREVAYGGLPKASRARLHAAYADWLAAEDPGDARAGALAYHYAEAVNPEIAELAWRGREDEAERLRVAALRWLGRATELALGLGWIENALELATPDSRSLARALNAKAHREDDLALAGQAIEIAERLDDVELLSFGFFTRFGIEQLAARFHEAYEWDLRRRALAGRFTDPDHLALMHWNSSAAELALGHLAEADAQAARHDAIAARLSPHHAIHALGNLVTVDEAAGHWERLHARQERAERGVAANADTPCIYNARSLLACAVACAELGLEDRKSVV